MPWPVAQIEIYSPRLAGWVASLTVPSWLFTAASLTPTPAEGPRKIDGDTIFMGIGKTASSCPVDTLSTCTSALPVVGAFHGTMKLICPGDTYCRGAAVPLTVTSMSPSVVGKGRGLGRSAS